MFPNKSKKKKETVEETPVVPNTIAQTEVAVPATPSATLNTPRPEPIQAGHGSRDFGRTEKIYPTPSNNTEDGGQEEA